MCFYNSTTSQPELFYYKDVLTTGLIFYKQLPLWSAANTYINYFTR